MARPKYSPIKGGGKASVPRTGQFKKGYDPRRKTVVKSPGRYAAPYRIKEALGQVLRMTPYEVECVRKNVDSENVARLLAAERVLVALNGSGPRADRAFDQIADRTEGKPHQSHEVKVDQTVDPSAVLKEVKNEVGLDEIDEATARGDEVMELPSSPTSDDSGVDDASDTSDASTKTD